MVNVVLNVRWKRPIGSAKTFECSAIAVATHGWASCNKRARPAPRNIAASRSTFHVTDSGPNTPAIDPAARARTKLSSASRSSALIIEQFPATHSAAGHSRSCDLEVKKRKPPAKETNDRMHNRIEINRAPVLTLWAAVVAERLGFDWQEALTLGRAVADARSRSGKRDQLRRQKGAFSIDLLNRKVPAGIRKRA